MSEGISVILFDLGNVLVDFDHSIAAKRIANFCDKSAEEIYNLFFESELTKTFEEGRITPKDFYLKLKEILNLRLSYEAFVPIWDEIFFLSPKNRAVYAIANSLREDYKVIMVTNINILHYDYLKKNFPVFDVFEKVYASCEVGIIKPKKEIYQKILNELNVKPENVFYTDDRQILIDGALKMGIKSFLFRGAQQLREDLAAAGVNL